MCGRYVLGSLLNLPEDLSERFNIRQIPFELLPTFNAAPGQLLPVIVALPDESRTMQLMHWGLIPRWSRTAKMPPPINARLETVDEKPLFRGLVKQQRCLIPASGFYEWNATGDGPRQPWFIHDADQPILAFAGLWDETGPESDNRGEISGSFTILTTAATGLVANLHHRMPVIPGPALEEAWLDPGQDPAVALSLLRAAPAPDLVAWPVSTAVNNVRNNRPDLIEPLDQPVLPGFQES